MSNPSTVVTNLRVDHSHGVDSSQSVDTSPRVDSSLSRSMKTARSASHEMTRLRLTPCDVRLASGHVTLHDSRSRDAGGTV